VSKSGVNRTPFDVWTLVHAGSGIAAQKVGLGFWPTAIGMVVFEVIEWPLFESRFPNRQPEVLSNKVVDVIAGLAGWLAARSVGD